MSNGVGSKGTRAWSATPIEGAVGLSDLGGLLLGSVAHKVVQLSSCPVLVVRDEESLRERHNDVLRAQTRFQA